MVASHLKDTTVYNSVSLLHGEKSALYTGKEEVMIISSVFVISMKDIQAYDFVFCYVLYRLHNIKATQRLNPWCLKTQVFSPGSLRGQSRLP